MTEPTRTSSPTIDETPPYSRSDSILFQSWLILFLLVICFALVNYLMSFKLLSFLTG